MLRLYLYLMGFGAGMSAAIVFRAYLLEQRIVLLVGAVCWWVCTYVFWWLS